MIKEFKEKWKNKRYQAGVKLSVSSLFVLLVFILILLGGGNEIENDSNNNNSIDDINIGDSVSFSLTDFYVIDINSSIGNAKYNFLSIDNGYEIVKIISDKEYFYKKVLDKYYKKENDNYVLTFEKDIFDIDYTYLDINNINNYLSIANRENDLYVVYLKDILLDNESDKYISFKFVSDDILEIDYTDLFNVLYDAKYSKYTVRFISNLKD